MIYYTRFPRGFNKNRKKLEDENWAVPQIPTAFKKNAGRMYDKKTRLKNKKNLIPTAKWYIFTC